MRSWVQSLSSSVVYVYNTDLVEISQVKSQLSYAFEMKDLGDLHYFLGIKVIHIHDGILLTQRHYIRNILLHKFGMTECDPSSLLLIET